MSSPLIENPFRPGAGHAPVYLAGRDKEQTQFRALLDQSVVTQNAIITGLRGIGKTVLLESLKPIAQASGWLWAGNSISGTASQTEERLLRRIIVDLTALLAPLVVYKQEVLPFGYVVQPEHKRRPLEFDDLWKLYMETAGLSEDKLKAVLLQVASLIAGTRVKGIVFAYDEAQNLANHGKDREFPLSLLLDVFSSIQRMPLPCRFMLVLTGLPTLGPKLNEARTYTERMFRVMQLEKLDDVSAREAIVKPIQLKKSPLTFADYTIDRIIEISGGYPYFLQFIGKEVFDAWIGKMSAGDVPSVPERAIVEKLDQDFFAPRWARTSDRQQEFMKVIATLPNGDEEFSVQDIVAASRNVLTKGFTANSANQMLMTLIEKGLIYKSRRGGYCFAVPMLAAFINRQAMMAALNQRRPSSDSIAR